MENTVAIPGQFLGYASKYNPGAGTHLHQGNVYASILGTVTLSKLSTQNGPPKRLTRITASEPTVPVTISVSQHCISRELERREVLPEVGNIVLGRVVRITPRQAVVAILVVNESVLEGEWQGVIRAQDVRATEKDKVKIYESFRPGDIVRAQVISLGDQAHYYLATTRNALGVIMATSEAGNVMYPVSWKEYKDPETGMSEPRKVAKPL